VRNHRGHCGQAQGRQAAEGARRRAARALGGLQVLNDKGQGEDAWIIKALDHIAEQNDNISEGLAIHGLNLSLGGPFDNTVYGCGFSPVCVELRRLWRDGVLVVVASGNEGQVQVRTSDGDNEINNYMSIGDPANLEDCIAVGSVNADKPHLYGVSSFSSRGPTADGAPNPTSSPRASASVLATHASAAMATCTTRRAAPAWPRRTCPVCWRHSFPCAASFAADPTK
jgi:subtilisin family serine protease